MITPQFDINERAINVGDWIAQAYSLGQCPALKVSKVIAYTDNGKIRVMGFERRESWYRPGTTTTKLATPDVTWTRSDRAYALAFSERMCVIDKIAPSLQEHIDTVYGGDPLAKPSVEV